MDQNQNTPTPTPITPSVEPKKPSSFGGTIAIVLILVLVVVGALYLWGERIAKAPASPEEQIETLQEQSSSTEPAAIQADLEAQSPEDFEAELDAAFTEIDAAFDAN